MKNVTTTKQLFLFIALHSNGAISWRHVSEPLRKLAFFNRNIRVFSTPWLLKNYPFPFTVIQKQPCTLSREIFNRENNASDSLIKIQSAYVIQFKAPGRGVVISLATNNFALSVTEIWVYTVCLSYFYQKLFRWMKKYINESFSFFPIS